MASVSKNQVKELNQTLLINKIICCLNWFVFAFALELAAENRQIHKENSPYDEVFRFSYQNFRDFFGPAGLFVEICMGFFESFNKKLGRDQWSKDGDGNNIEIHWIKKAVYFSLVLSTIILLSYTREKILEKYNKNLIFKILLVALFSIFLMICKIYLKAIINSITNDPEKKRSKKNKILIVFAALAISAFCLYLNLLIQRSQFFQQNLFFKNCLMGIAGFFCYSVLIELLVYNILINNSVETLEQKIKKNIWSKFIKEETKEDGSKARKTNLMGKIFYFFFLFALNVLTLSVLFIIDKIFERFNQFQIGGWAEFGILNFKEILCGIASFGLIYGFNINSVIIDIIKDVSIERSREIKDLTNTKRDFKIAFFSYMVLAPTLLTLNISLGSIILFKMMKTENFFMKCFGCDQKFFPALMTAMFILASISTGLLSFVSAEIQNNAILIEEKKTADSSDKKSFFSVDYWASVCATKQEPVVA